MRTKIFYICFVLFVFVRWKIFLISYLLPNVDMIKDYIEQYIDLYGIDSISSNVHNLCHLIKDVERFGVLPKISAYPFENMLQFMKNLIRHGNRPLSQAANRLSELVNMTAVGSSKLESKKNIHT